MISSLVLAQANGFSQLSPAIEALGWTLLHFVWQGAALGLALACFLAVGRRLAPSIRYLAGCCALALMTLSVAATFAWHMAVIEARPSLASGTLLGAATAERPPLGNPLFEQSTDSPRGRATKIEDGRLRNPILEQRPPAGPNASHALAKMQTVPVNDFGQSTPLPPDVAPKLATSAFPIASPVPIVNVEHLWNSKEKLFAAFQPWLPWIVGLWICGVGLLALRLAVGWGIIRRLRHQGEAPKDPAWCARLERLRVRLGVSAPVRLLCSASASVPMVIGWLRPVVLVPSGLLAGLTASQLEAVLAHELAHIRRHDYLVNLLQNVVETCLFYHPAIWWVSRQIRTEREHCCDDLAAAICGSTLDYARALTALAELRHTSGVFGLAATGGSLINRIARLAGVGNPEPRLGWPLPAFLLATGAAIALLSASSASQSSDATKESPEVSKAIPQSIVGRVLDPSGKPVANAECWLTAWDAKAYPFDGLPVVAQSRSTSDGRFVLPVDAATARNLADSDRSQVEVWVRKTGLSLGYHRRRGGLPNNAIVVRLRPVESVALRLLKPDGSACANARVTPTIARYSDEVGIPQVIQEGLASQTDANGRVRLSGLCNDEIALVKFQSDAGIQCCHFPNWEWPDSQPGDIVLRKTGMLKGRLVLPEGSKAGLPSAKIHVMTSSDPPPGGRTAWTDSMTIRPDRSGKFTAPNVPEGSVRIAVEVPEDSNCRPDERLISRNADGRPLKMTAGGTLKVDIPMSRFVRVKGIVRDARTKQPLRGVRSLLLRKSEFGNGSQEKWTDDEGRFALWIPPYVNYELNVELPAGFARVVPASPIALSVDSSLPEQKMPPIELIRSRSLEGTVVDASGRACAGVDVAAAWGPQLAQPGITYLHVTKAQKWTTTDAQGHFHCDDLANEEELTLTPVRAGIVLGEPLKIGANDGQPVRLQFRKAGLGAICGRVVNSSDLIFADPIRGAGVAVRMQHNNEWSVVWRGRTNGLGEYETPTWFPQGLVYQVTARSADQEIASSPRRLSDGRESFDNLIIGGLFVSGPLVTARPIEGTDVVATVNGQPILASQVLAKTPSLLTDARVSLLEMPLKNGRTGEEQFHDAQVAAIGRALPDVVKTQLMAQALLEKLEPPQKAQVEGAITKMFVEYLSKLKNDLKVSSRYQIDQKLKLQGTSLVDLRSEFRLRLLADEWRRSTQRWRHVDIKAVEDFYKAHEEEYTVPEKVRWRLAEITFERQGGRDQARSVAEKVLAELRRGDDFKAVARKYFAGRRLDEGNWSVNPYPALDDQSRPVANHFYACADAGKLFAVPECARVQTAGLNIQFLSRSLGSAEAKAPPKKRPNHEVRQDVDADNDFWTGEASLADPRLSEAMSRLEPGQTSGILEGSDSFRIIQLIERRPGGKRPFDEVANSIREKIADQMCQQMIDDLYRRASIESPYLPDSDSHEPPNTAEKYRPGRILVRPADVPINRPEKQRIEARCDVPGTLIRVSCGRSRSGAVLSPQRGRFSKGTFPSEPWGGLNPAASNFCRRFFGLFLFPFAPVLPARPSAPYCDAPATRDSPFP